MDSAAFSQTLNSIRDLDASPGPSRNVFEPKFEARTQAEALRNSLLNSFKAVPSIDTQLQLAQVFVFLGMNFHETEEDKNAEQALCKAYTMAKTAMKSELYDFESQPAMSVAEILHEEISTTSFAAERVARWIETLNALGVVLAGRPDVEERVHDARKILHVAERTYDETTSRDVSEDCRTELNRLMTNTVFYLAQAYGAVGDVKGSSKYVHLTMVRQMRSKVEFNRKDWATNAIHLAGFYAGEGLFDCACHCLSAARVVMPQHPADEETLGVVAWGFGKVFKTMLKLAAAGREATANPVPDRFGRFQWWVDLPVEGAAPPAPVALPSNFAEAVVVFRTAVTELKLAATFYTFDTCCPDHIAIHQDISECYKYLIEFEADTERQAAMHHRRIEALKPFPESIAFNAYATLIRQLWFDLGESASDLFDLRDKQRQSREGKPLSERQCNHLCRTAIGYYQAFLRTFADKQGNQPTKVEVELKTPYFRALMRIARLEGKIVSKSPEDEYKRIGDVIKLYDDILRFVEVNKIAGPETAIEVDLARQMKELLPGKQRDIRRTSR